MVVLFGSGSLVRLLTSFAQPRERDAAPEHLRVRHALGEGMPQRPGVRAMGVHPDGEVVDQVGELRLRADGNAAGVARAGQLGRVPTVVDAGDLGGGERHHLDVGVVAVHDVEVMEVAPTGAHDDDAPHLSLP